VGGGVVWGGGCAPPGGGGGAAPPGPGLVRDQLGTYALAWYVAGGLAMVAAVLSLLLRRTRRPSAPVVQTGTVRLAT